MRGGTQLLQLLDLAAYARSGSIEIRSTCVKWKWWQPLLVGLIVHVCCACFERSCDVRSSSRCCESQYNMHRIQRSNGVQMTNRNLHSGIAAVPSVLCVGPPISHVVSVAALLHLHCCCARSRLGMSKMTRSSLMRLQRSVAAGTNAKGNIMGALL